jgi:starch-binding outer membrane protein, SusD/RagB family
MTHKLRYIIAAGVLLTIGAGCSKSLETKPQQSVLAITTFDQLQAQMRGAYRGLKSVDYYDGSSGSASAWSSLGDVMGDDFIEALESLGNWRQLGEWRYTADDGAVAGAFQAAYTVIGRANDVLRFTANFETGSTENGAKQIEAQALALRANAHFDLMRYFAQSLRRDSDSLGVPYVTIIDPANPFKLSPKRNTVKECYDAIYKDLDAATALFREAGNPSKDDKSIIDSNAVNCMRARIGLYCGNYADAIQAATAVIDNVPLASADEWPLIWTDKSFAEVIWSIPSDQTLTPGFPNNGNAASYRVSQAMSDIIFGPAGGVRSDPAVIERDVNGIADFKRTVSYKYGGTASFKVFRTAEMYLIRAEAKYRTGDATALDDLNDLRGARAVDPGAETGTALFDAIMLERRIELLAEGHRWHDIKRTTRTIVKTECGTDDGSLQLVCSVAPSSRSWIWPIPITQINLNPNLSQNPNY